MSSIRIVPVIPFEDGRKAGRQTGRRQLIARTRKALRSPLLRQTLGAMDWSDLGRYAMARLEAPPDLSRYPELQDLHPEKVDFLRGLAEGAGCSLAEAALSSYVQFRAEIDHWYAVYQANPEPGHCSGILMVGPDGVLGGQSCESGPPPKPRSYRYRAPGPYRGLRQLKPLAPSLVLRKPRTGYIESWGVGNEKGVACFAGNSCGVWLDEPIEDTWPIGPVPLLRFARDIDHLAELYRRYTLFNWGRGSSVWADRSGNGMIVEKSYRRIGIRMIGAAQVIWSTEGHFESPEMHAYLRAKRLEYLARMGRHAGADDMQYATDCAVRFTHIGELCHMPWGRGYEHIRRVLTDHSTFPRAVCRHGGPDTDPYDTSVTMMSWFHDLTHNRTFHREWVPWKKFPCQVPERVTHFPPVPG